jgi:hypothetical protein
VRAAHQHWRDRGVAFVIGLPNEKWGSRTRELDWRPVADLQWLIRVMRPEVMLARRSGIHSLAQWSSVAAVWNGIWDRRLRGDESVTISESSDEDTMIELDRGTPTPTVATMGAIHDDRWLRWRFLSAPRTRATLFVAANGLTPRGYAACRIERRGNHDLGLIADVRAAEDSPKVLASLLRITLERLRTNGATLAAALTVPGSAVHGLLQRAGFRPRWGAFRVHVVPLDRSLESIVTDCAARWDLAGGDFDVV